MQLPILIVEDSPEDYATVRRALRKVGASNPIYHCHNGDEALQFLYRNPPYDDPETAPRPGLILLDLNLPGTHGREVLAQIKGDETLRSIPIVILTSSRDDRDIFDCYNEGANSYIQKPMDLQKFQEAIKQLIEFWFGIAILP